MRALYTFMSKLEHHGSVVSAAGDRRGALYIAGLGDSVQKYFRELISWGQGLRVMRVKVTGESICIQLTSCDM